MMINQKINRTAKYVLAGFLAGAISVGVADERGQSIMFGDKPDSQAENSLTTTHSPMESMHKTDERCERLAKEIDQLKGKPQRRHAAIQRFKNECGSEPLNEKMDQ